MSYIQANQSVLKVAWLDILSSRELALDRLMSDSQQNRTGLAGLSEPLSTPVLALFWMRTLLGAGVT